MKRNILVAVVAAILLISPNALLSQDETSKLQKLAGGEDAPDLQWLWGEVVSVDLAGKAVIVKYPDYETEKDKEMTVVADDKTVYENIVSLEDLKPNDMVSIDYKVGAHGKNVVERLSVERLQEEGAMQPETDIPQDLLIGEENPTQN